MSLRIRFHASRISPAIVSNAIFKRTEAIDVTRLPKMDEKRIISTTIIFVELHIHS